MNDSSTPPEHQEQMTSKEATTNAEAAKAQAKAIRPWYKKPLPLIGIVVLFVIGINAVSGGGSDLPNVTSTTVATSTPSNETTTAAEVPSTETVSQQNAVRSAKKYLDFSPFSRTGLIKQLEFEEYSADDATYGVDAQSADWNEQAAKSGKNYLEMSAFSRAGLIKQLEFEGYTNEEAMYGADANGL